MKSLLTRRPLLAELTGISEGRLNSFATHLRAYLSGVPSDNDSSEIHYPQSSSTCEYNSNFPQSSYKEGPPESSSSGKIAPEGNVVCVDSLSFASANSVDPSNSTFFQKDKVPETNGIYPLTTLNFLEAFSKPAQLPLSIPNIQQFPSSFSPYYCWCPLVNSQLPTPSSESLLRLPPLSSLLSKPSLNFAELPPLDFPSFLPDSLFGLPTSQQVPTFTPLMCDPIIHIPVCSSGPYYLVSVGPTIPALNPNLMDPLLLNAEKSARETLRMLISGTKQPNPQLLEVVLPSVSVLIKQNVAAAATRVDSIDEKENLFYSGTSPFDAGME